MFSLVILLIPLFQITAFKTQSNPLEYTNQNFKSSNSIYFDSSISNALSVPIENLCLSYYKKLTYTSGKFIDCAINNSRPFHLCQNCLEAYLEYKDVENLIQTDPDLYATTLYTNGLKCSEIVEAADRVQTAVKITDIIDDIWATSNCNDCFESYSFVNATLNFSLKGEIGEFYEKQAVLITCISNFTMVKFLSFYKSHFELERTREFLL